MQIHLLSQPFSHSPTDHTRRQQIWSVTFDLFYLNKWNHQLTETNNSLHKGTSSKVAMSGCETASNVNIRDAGSPVVGFIANDAFVWQYRAETSTFSFCWYCFGILMSWNGSKRTRCQWKLCEVCYCSCCEVCASLWPTATVLHIGTEKILSYVCVWPHYLLCPHKCWNITSKLKPQYKYFDIEMQQSNKKLKNIWSHLKIDIWTGAATSLRRVYNVYIKGYLWYLRSYVESGRHRSLLIHLCDR